MSNSIKVNIGGDRLGSGNKMQTRLHNYNRSTHNLSKIIQTSMTSGILYPLYTNIGLNGDTFDIDLNAMVKTLPTIAPLFGSFKFQVDVFKADFRLYQGILHNNPINIGLQMDKVLLPQVEYYYDLDTTDPNEWQKIISQSSIAAYLGTRTLPYAHYQDEDGTRIQRLAIPYLAYYDIFKNYYANKQEEKFYYVTKDLQTNLYKNLPQNTDGNNKIATNKINVANILLTNNTTLNGIAPNTGKAMLLKTKNGQKINQKVGMATELISQITWSMGSGTNDVSVFFNNNQTLADGSVYTCADDEIFLKVQNNRTAGTINAITIDTSVILRSNYNDEIYLEKADLKEIDDMRNKLLAVTTLNTKKVISGESDDGFYSNVFGSYTNEVKNELARTMPKMHAPLNGLVVKTYQSDIFNNWLSSETIDGLNGIAAVTAIDTSDNKFTIDALNLAEKVYLMLNRIAVAGSTYQDYLKAVYGEEVASHHETPEYCGGMSSEIVFEELVSTAAAEGNPQGTLAGKGTLIGKKGGHITIKPKEPCVIMVIASITPRLVYTQGNKWWAEEIKSTFDLHKPQLDGIGFQDLMEYQMAGWAAGYNGTGEIYTNPAAGKQPAWINYMTDVNEAYGDFAEDNNADYMVLARNYEGKYNEETGILEIADLTTYIDPTKFNYPFASQKLNAQNFWTQLSVRNIARRKMSAKIIPNL